MFFKQRCIYFSPQFYKNVIFLVYEKRTLKIDICFHNKNNYTNYGCQYSHIVKIRSILTTVSFLNKDGNCFCDVQNATKINVNLCLYFHQFPQYIGVPQKIIKETVLTVGLVVRPCKKRRELSNMYEISVKKFEGFSEWIFM